MKTPEPPEAAREPHVMIEHGHKRVDHYYWIRDDERKDPEVLALLEAENSYTNAVMAHTASLQDELYREIAGRLVANDATVPIKEDEYFYHQEFREGGEYPIYLRRHVNDDEAEIMLDVNELAKGHEYYKVGNWSVSEDDQILAYAEDKVSRRIYTIKFKNLTTGELLADEITNAAPGIAWTADSESLFYTRKHPDTLLPFQVYRHVLGTPVSEDKLIYEELDHQFYTRVYASRSKKYLVISSQSTDSSEIRLIEAANPENKPVVVLPREDKHEYRIRHVGDSIFILTNWQADNFRLMVVKDSQLGDKSTWQEVVPGRSDVLLSDMEVFEDFIALEEKVAGLSQIRIIDRHTGTEKQIAFPDEAYAASLHTNPEVTSQKLRYVYSSMTRPESVFEYDVKSSESTLLKQDKVLGDFNPDNYSSHRTNITARDGTQVPVSIVYRDDKFSRGKNPIFLYGYGSYGYAIEPGFSAKRLSLLDRGVVYAIVHVRGGDDLGFDWYDQGRLSRKRNTFWDFIDATDGLIEAGYGAKDKVIAAGGSAGGLLMGVIANEAPEKYLAIIAQVPFVDVLTTMLDESIPLTTGEFSEWGNPKDKAVYDYMLSYSPYDQIKKQQYPHMFVTTGLHDSQVQYYEPTKWVSKLRYLKQDNNLLLMHIDMETGHGGASGRYERYRTDALEYAFVLDLLK